MAITYTLDPSSPTVLLDAATSTGAGKAFAIPVSPLGGVYQNFAWSIATTGSPSGISTTLQVSVDGTLWTTIDTSTATGGEVRTVGPKAGTFIRANVATLSGGTNPTVTVTVQPAS